MKVAQTLDKSPHNAFSFVFAECAVFRDVVFQGGGHLAVVDQISLGPCFEYFSQSSVFRMIYQPICTKISE